MSKNSKDANKLQETCQWPGCTNPALCGSGNYRYLLVCGMHFTITNGTPREGLKVGGLIDL